MSVVLFLCIAGTLGSWEMCGPGGTDVIDLHTATTPTDNEIVFSLCEYPDSYECFASDNNGESWESTVSSDAECYSVTSDDLGRVFITGEGIVLISPDLGDSWAISPTVPDAMMMSLAVDPSDSQHLLGAVRNADSPLIESNDGGATWDVVTTLPGEIRGFSVAFSASNPQTVYLAGNPLSSDYYLMVFKSTDNGETWTEISPSPECYVSAIADIQILIDETDPDQLFVTGDEVLMTTTNGGSTWTESLDANYDIVDIEYAYTPGTIYAAIRYGFYKSTDNGATWVPQLGFPTQIYCFTLSNFSGRFHLGTHLGNHYGPSAQGPWILANTGIPGGSFYAMLENENDDSGFPVFTGHYFLNEEQFSWDEAGEFSSIAELYLARAAADPDILFVAGNPG